MNKFVTFRHKSNGVIADYPEHYENHPVFGEDLERYEPSDEYEEDKTVVDNHELPVEQRAIKTATPTAPMKVVADKSDKGAENTKEN